VKAALNLSNGLLEKCRREADRLLDRKTIVEPESLNTLDQHWNTTVISANAVTSALTRLWTIARSYL
jgi:predicted metallopeptidase